MVTPYISIVQYHNKETSIDTTHPSYFLCPFYKTSTIFAFCALWPNYMIRDHLVHSFHLCITPETIRYSKEPKFFLVRNVEDNNLGTRVFTDTRLLWLLSLFSVQRQQTCIILLRKINQLILRVSQIKDYRFFCCCCLISLTLCFPPLLLIILGDVDIYITYLTYYCDGYFLLSLYIHIFTILNSTLFLIQKAAPFSLAVIWFPANGRNREETGELEACKIEILLLQSLTHNSKEANLTTAVFLGLHQLCPPHVFQVQGVHGFLSLPVPDYLANIYWVSDAPHS